MFVPTRSSKKIWYLRSIWLPKIIRIFCRRIGNWSNRSKIRKRHLISWLKRNLKKSRSWKEIRTLYKAKWRLIRIWYKARTSWFMIWSISWVSFKVARNRWSVILIICRNRLKSIRSNRSVIKRIFSRNSSS